MTLPPEAYLWFKTLHIVGVVVWFAGHPCGRPLSSNTA